MEKTLEPKWHWFEIGKKKMFPKSKLIYKICKTQSNTFDSSISSKTLNEIKKKKGEKTEVHGIETLKKIKICHYKKKRGGKTKFIVLRY